jgi:hypothetical protein
MTWKCVREGGITPAKGLPTETYTPSTRRWRIDFDRETAWHRFRQRSSQPWEGLGQSAPVMLPEAARTPLWNQLRTFHGGVADPGSTQCAASQMERPPRVLVAVPPRVLVAVLLGQRSLLCVLGRCCASRCSARRGRQRRKARLGRPGAAFPAPARGFPIGRLCRSVPRTDDAANESSW